MESDCVDQEAHPIVAHLTFPSNSRSASETLVVEYRHLLILLNEARTGLTTIEHYWPYCTSTSWGKTNFKVALQMSQVFKGDFDHHRQIQVPDVFEEAPRSLEVQSSCFAWMSQSLYGPKRALSLRKGCHRHILNKNFSAVRSTSLSARAYRNILRTFSVANLLVSNDVGRPYLTTLETANDGWSWPWAQTQL